MVLGRVKQLHGIASRNPGLSGGADEAPHHDATPWNSKADWTMTDPDQGGSRRGAIAGLAIAAVLLVVGLWLAHELTASSKMQDCLMSGRTNCNVIPAQ